jgi:Domain of unknown function (DUF4169)
MTDIVNLRRARKSKARAEKSKQADVNRVKFGQSKAEKLLQKAETVRAEAAFQAHKREDLK